MKWIFDVLIRFYQKTISFDHGPLRFLAPEGVCKFRPTCSDFARGALQKYPLHKAFFLSFKRILRCHPWAEGGRDEP